jgi:hypothetical protein
MIILNKYENLFRISKNFIKNLNIKKLNFKIVLKNLFNLLINFLNNFRDNFRNK